MPAVVKYLVGSITAIMSISAQIRPTGLSNLVCHNIFIITITGFFMFCVVQPINRWCRCGLITLHVYKITVITWQALLQCIKCGLLPCFIVCWPFLKRWNTTLLLLITTCSGNEIYMSRQDVLSIDPAITYIMMRGHSPLQFHWTWDVWPSEQLH